MFQRILVPLDGTDQAAAALPVATELARRFGAALLLLEMVPERREALGLAADVASGAMTDPNVFGAQVTAREAVAESYISAVAEQLTADGLDARFAIGTGDEDKGIIQAAIREQVDLIVMATQPRRGLGRLLFGSTTDDVVHHSPVPVLVVPVADDAG